MDPLHLGALPLSAGGMSGLGAGLGLELPSPAYLVGAIVFGLIGMAVYYRARRQQQTAAKWLGVLLMAYPYGVSSTWGLYALGLALCAAVVVEERQRG